MSKILDAGGPPHDQPNPFPMIIKITVSDKEAKGMKPKTVKMKVINELCTCGDMRTSHRDAIQFGHGPCAYCGKCKRFTWKNAIQVPVNE